MFSKVEIDLVNEIYKDDMNLYKSHFDESELIILNSH